MFTTVLHHCVQERMDISSWRFEAKCFHIFQGILIHIYCSIVASMQFKTQTLSFIEYVQNEVLHCLPEKVSSRWMPLYVVAKPVCIVQQI